MTTELTYLRQLYLEDLGKTVNYGGNDRPRVRHVGNWERIETTLAEGVDEQLTIPLADDDDRNVWVWSDLHFGHKNIIGFSERPYDNVDQMDEHLIANHNDYVKENDISIWVGDVAFGSTEYANNILDQCNGYKILIVGNHDFHKRKLREFDFDEVHLMQHYIVDGVDLVMTHYPMDNLVEPYINVHGHLHAFPVNNAYNNSNQHINVNCEFHNYKPIKLDEVVRIAKIRRENMDL